MRILILLLALLLTATPLTVRAQSRLPGLSEGVEYRSIEGGQPYRVLPPGMVEVAEVFAYTCPHCAHFAPMLDTWAKRLPAHARLVYVPAVFGRDDPWSRAYFAQEATHTVATLHPQLFRAIHGGGTSSLPPNATTSQIVNYATRFASLNVPAFNAAINDEAALLPKLRKAYEFAQRSGVEGTPSLIVAGRYMILGNSYEELLANAGKVVAALAPRRATPASRPAAPAARPAGKGR